MSACSDSSGEGTTTPEALPSPAQFSAPLSPKRDFKPNKSSPLAQVSSVFSVPATVTTKPADASSPQRKEGPKNLCVDTPRDDETHSLEAAPICNTLAPSDRAPDSPQVIHQRRASVVSQSPNPFGDDDDVGASDSDEEKIIESNPRLGSVEYDHADDDDDNEIDDGDDYADNDSDHSFGTPPHRRIGSNEAMSSSTYPVDNAERELRNGKGLQPDSATSPAQVEESEISVRVSSAGSSGSGALQRKLEDLEVELGELRESKVDLVGQNQKLKDEVGGLKSEMGSVKASLEGENAQLRNRHAADLVELKQAHEAEMENLRQAHEERMAAEKGAFAKARDALKEEVTKWKDSAEAKQRELETANAKISALESEVAKEKASCALKLKLMEPVLSNLDTNMQTRIDSLVIKDKRQHELISSLQDELMNAKEKEVECDAYLKHYRTQMAEQKERILHLEERCELMNRRYTSLAWGSASTKQ